MENKPNWIGVTSIDNLQAKSDRNKWKISQIK